MVDSATEDLIYKAELQAYEVLKALDSLRYASTVDHRRLLEATAEIKRLTRYLEKS